MKITFFVLSILISFLLPITASDISSISLSELQEKADIIALGKVIKVFPDGIQDEVTIKVDSVLKGTKPNTPLTFRLVSRGGLKDFDPALKEGQFGVFFLKEKADQSGVEKAYWGSIAIFEKTLNFTSTP